MNLIDRYLDAVKQWLPRAQRKDIIAELSEDIHQSVSEEESRLARSLSDTELDAVLGRYGSPTQVAERYAPRGRSLIGPLLFPRYALVLKLILAYFMVPWLIVWVVMVIASPAYRAAHPGLALFSTLGTLWTTALYAFAGVTLLFALLERAHLRTGFLDRWNPRTPVPAEAEALANEDEMRLGAGIELVISGLITAWWLDLRHAPGNWALDNAGHGLALAPIWGQLYWPIFALLVAGVAQALHGLIRPRRTRTRTYLGLARAVATLVLGALLLRAGRWVEVLSTESPDKAATVSMWINLTVLVTIAIIMIASGVEVVVAARRLRRSRAAGAPRKAAAAPAVVAALLGAAVAVIDVRAAQSESSQAEAAPQAEEAGDWTGCPRRVRGWSL